MAVLVQPHRWNRDTRLHIPHERRPLKYTAGGGFQPGTNQQNPGYPLRDARRKGSAAPRGCLWGWRIWSGAGPKMAGVIRDCSRAHSA
jgi:hypothetical protein